MKNKSEIFIIILVGLLLFSFNTLAFAQGFGPLGSFSEAEFDDTLIRNAVGNLFRMIEGAMGALIMVVAGLFALIAAARGGYAAAISLLVVAVGAFVLRALVSLFFGSDFPDYQL